MSFNVYTQSDSGILVEPRMLRQQHGLSLERLSPKASRAPGPPLKERLLDRDAPGMLTPPLAELHSNTWMSPTSRLAATRNILTSALCLD